MTNIEKCTCRHCQREVTLNPSTRIHPDDRAVDTFAAAMKEKLAKKRAEGRHGWQDKALCSNAFLTHLLRENLDKGDPVDVGNLAMMLYCRGESIARDPESDAMPCVGCGNPSDTATADDADMCYPCAVEFNVTEYSNLKARFIELLKRDYPNANIEDALDELRPLPEKPVFSAGASLPEKLPCDVAIGAGIFRRGVPTRLVLEKIKWWQNIADQGEYFASTYGTADPDVPQSKGDE